MQNFFNYLWLINSIVAIVVILGCAIFIAYLEISVKRERKQMVANLAEAKCPICGAKFGIEAATRAPQTYGARCHEARLKNPDLKIYFSKEWPIECPKCKHESHFNYRTQRLDS